MLWPHSPADAAKAKVLEQLVAGDPRGVGNLAKTTPLNKTFSQARLRMGGLGSWDRGNVLCQYCTQTKAPELIIHRKETRPERRLSVD